MRALRTAGGAVRLDGRTPVPAPAAGEALIRTTRVAVSSTDVEVAGGLQRFDGTLGQEFVGVVDRVNGNDADGVTGRRVVGSVTTRCGDCDMCQSGLGTHCRNRAVIGMHGRDGALAEALTLPLANLVMVPDGVDDDHAIFALPLSAAIQAARQLTIEGKPYITVLGDGPLGLLMVQVMSRLNASVRLIGRYSEKLALCEKWGVKHRHVDDVGRRADQDIVVDCTGSIDGLGLAFAMVRPRGTVVLKTLLAPASRPSLDLAPVVLNELNVIGSSFGPIRAAIDELATGGVDVVSLISRRMKLADGPKLLEAASRPGTIKVVVSP